MKLLALETATEACSVALYVDGQILERHEIAPRRHAELVLPWIAELLATAGIRKAQLDGIACSHGPGAFTGVRLAVALSQGLALALDRPVIGVSTLDVLALPAMRTLDAESDRRTGVMAAIDARMGEVYLADYRRDDNGVWIRNGEELVIAPADVVLADDAPRAAVGTGFAAADSILLQRLGAQLAGSDATALPHAGDVARLAVQAFERGEGVAPEQLQPAYLRNKVALTLAEQGKPMPASLDD